MQIIKQIGSDEMRKKKRTAMIGAFALGAFLFAGTALADIMDKSGYDQLKDAVKATATNCTENYQSFTADVSMVMKDNGKVIFSEESVTKYDSLNGASEQTSTTEDATNRNRNYSYYRYSDKVQSISRSANDNNYVVTNYREKKDTPLLNKEDNPFNQEEAKDLERILDALVINLKDHVIVTENSDGSKSLSGNLSEGQIPALINALASFQMKQEFNGNRRDGIIDLASDVYVKEVQGTATISEDGSLENILGTASVSGLDEQGEVHEISLEVLFKLSDVNATKVVKPDLTGKKVITQEERDFKRAYQPTPEKFVGKFKNDIIMENDGRFVKIGERHLEITLLNNKEVQGNYREELKEGFEKYAVSDSNYTFKAKFSNEKDTNNAVLEGITEEGNKVTGDMYFNGYDGRIYLNLNRGYYGNVVINDTDFRPDFD